MAEETIPKESDELEKKTAAFFIALVKDSPAVRRTLLICISSVVTFFATVKGIPSGDNSDNVTKEDLKPINERLYAIEQGVAEIRGELKGMEIASRRVTQK